MMFNKDSFLHYHTTDVHSGFRPEKTVYEGFVQDSEGKPWGFIKSLNLYEQQQTGIRMDPAEFQRYNIDILGYGSNDGDGPTTTTTAATDYTTGADGIFEFLSDGALNTTREFSIVTNSTAYEVSGGGDPKLHVQLASTSVLTLQEGTSPFIATINPAPPFIGLYINNPVGVKGWYIAEYSGSGGNYNYVRSVKGTSFPDPITTSLTQPLAVVFYATDPGSVGTWSDYTT